MNTILRFGANYQDPPFFNTSPDKMGYIDISELKLSRDLQAQITKWDETFQLTFCDEYPPDSGFSSEIQLDAHNSEGMALCKRIQAELGEYYIIEFFPIE